MKFVSWNVNGFRAILGKGFYEFFKEQDADIFCLQETKLQEGQHDAIPEGYFEYWNYAQRKGYSGTAVFSKREPLQVAYGLGMEAHDQEGRVITLEFPEFYFVTVYSPNAQDGLTRLDYRLEWEEAFRDYLQTLDQKKPVIICGDMNVAHQEIDLKNPKQNRNNAGFTDQERAKFSALLGAGFVDAFRHLYPERENAYTWWSYRFNARSRNAGWRIDYFIVSDRLKTRIKDSLICSEVQGSDHCPVILELD